MTERSAWSFKALLFKAWLFKTCSLKKAGRLIVISLFLTGCSSTRPPSNSQDLCSVFREKSSWYRAAKQSEKQWGTPVQIQMSIMYQESSFRHNVRPPRLIFCLSLCLESHRLMDMLRHRMVPGRNTWMKQVVGSEVETTFPMPSTSLAGIQTKVVV